MQCQVPSQCRPILSFPGLARGHARTLVQDVGVGVGFKNLIMHPAVRDVAVVGTPDDQWGQRICAVIVPRADAEVAADELLAFVRGRLRGSRTPDLVVWRDQLPHTATGKLLRRQLAAEIEKEY